MACAQEFLNTLNQQSEVHYQWAERIDHVILGRQYDGLGGSFAQSLIRAVHEVAKEGEIVMIMHPFGQYDWREQREVKKGCEGFTLIFPHIGLHFWHWRKGATIRMLLDRRLIRPVA
ncbi:hypothetical protein HN358_03425 [Candidatus Uhrbacteria bacterium]|nr:hypothetical protein [Candidatus Uhrbacteria bacterium]MBT7716978.1 hypothetical protein [Candidatus Uhrbacteria bacterium]